MQASPASHGSCPAASHSKKADPPRASAKLRKRQSAPLSLVLLASAATGFVFLLMELVWYRMLSPIFGGTAFTFGLILAVALLGIGIGGVIVLVCWREATPHPQWFCLHLRSGSAFRDYPVRARRPVVVLAMLLQPLGKFGFYGSVLGWFVLCSIIVLPAAIIAGIQFPMLLALLGRGRDGIGNANGSCLRVEYGWSDRRFARRRLWLHPYFHRKGDEAAIGYIDRFRAIGPTEAEAIRARLLWRQNRSEEARVAMADAIASLHVDPWPMQALIMRTINLAVDLVEAGKTGSSGTAIYDALQKPFAVYNSEEVRMFALIRVAISLDRGLTGEYLLRALEAAEPHTPWNWGFLKIRSACYTALQHPLAGDAQSDVVDFLVAEPARMENAELGRAQTPADRKRRKVTSAIAHCKCPRRESNSNLRFRKPLFYPLNYGDGSNWRMSICD